MRNDLKRLWLWFLGLLGDTRSPEIRDAPCSGMGMNNTPSRVQMSQYHQRGEPRVGRMSNEVRMDNTYVFDAAQMAPMRDARKPVLHRTDLPSAAYFISLVNLGLFDRRCNLNGFTNSWGFQVVYDKQELRMFRYPVVNHSPVVILSAEGMTRMMDIDFPLDEVYSVLNAMRDHVMAQKLRPDAITFLNVYAGPALGERKEGEENVGDIHINLNNQQDPNNKETP